MNREPLMSMSPCPRRQVLTAAASVAAAAARSVSTRSPTAAVAFPRPGRRQRKRHAGRCIRCRRAAGGQAPQVAQRIGQGAGTGRFDLVDARLVQGRLDRDQDATGEFDLEIEGVKPQKIDKEQYYLQVMGV